MYDGSGLLSGWKNAETKLNDKHLSGAGYASLLCFLHEHQSRK
jgi:hypothetical protein